MIQVLISTMFLNDPLELLGTMNIHTKAVIIDQCDRNFEEHILYKGKTIDIFHTTDRGLSRSRNLAIEKSSSEILIFADDDFVYSDNYDFIVVQAYEKFKDADAIIFGAVRADKYIYRHIPTGAMSKKYRYSINSIRITSKRASLLEKGLRFDNRFGAGSDICGGEDTIFVSDCFNAKMKFYSQDSIICTGLPNDRTSTWYSGYNKKFFEDKGTVYKRLSKLYLIFIYYFAIKNNELYKNSLSFTDAIRYMKKGAKRKF